MFASLPNAIVRSVAATLSLAAAALAQNVTYRDRAAFDAAAGNQTVRVENFDSFTPGVQIPELFGGLVPFRLPFPVAMFGAWGAGQFSGGGLLPTPTFRNTPLVIDFPVPVYGIGAYAFDDFDGSPFASVIELEITTTTGARFSVAEDVPGVGNVGFLGATSTQGIARAVWSIAGSGGNLELDGMRLISDLDTVPPVVAIASPLDGSTTAASSVTVNGTVLDGAAVSITSAPAGVLASVAAGGGVWSGDVPLAAEGPNTVTVNALDQFGNLGGSSITVVRDTIAPTASFVAPADGEVVSRLSVTVVVAVADATAMSVEFADGSTQVSAGEQVATRTLALMPGANRLVVAVLDAAGNRTQIERTVTVDLDVPVVTILAPADGAWFGPGQATAPVLAQVDDISPTTVTSAPTGLAASLPAGGGLVPGTVPLVEGLNTITVRASDPVNAAGSAAITVRLDTTPPLVAVRAPGAEALVRGTLDIAIDAEDAGIGVAELRCYLDGQNAPFAVLDAAPYELQLDTAALADGPHALVVQAIDRLGNSATSAVRTFVVDNTPPAVALLSPLANSVLSGTAELQLRVTDATSGVVTCSALTNGLVPAPLDPSFADAAPLPVRDLVLREDTARHGDGALAVRVRVVDAAGNVTEAEYPFTIFNSAPPACALEPASGSTVRGVVTLTATVTGGNYSEIELRVDGTTVGTSTSSPLQVPFDTRVRLDGAMRVEALVRWGSDRLLVTTARLSVDNTAVTLHPATLNLHGRSDSSHAPVIAELTGGPLASLLPTEAHGLVLRVQSGGTVVADSGWHGDDAVRDGKLKVRFERRRLAQAVLPALSQSCREREVVRVELWAEASGTAPGFLLGVVPVRVER